jgi:hypothetical protein
VGDDDTSSDSHSSSSSSASSTSDRYKTELCRSFEETRACRYGSKCQFAHGVRELREMPRHPKYKTELCKNFHARGACPYGVRCRFIHDELDHDRHLVAALGPHRVAELRRMLLSPALLQSPAISPVTSPRLQRRTKSNPISPVRPYHGGHPLYQPQPQQHHQQQQQQQRTAAAAPIKVPPASTSPVAVPVRSPTYAMSVSAVSPPARSPVHRPMQFELLRNVHASTSASASASASASSSTTASEDDDDDVADDGADSVDPLAIAAAALAEPDALPPRNVVSRSSPRLVPQRLFVDRTDASPLGAALMSEQDAHEIDQLVAELASSLENDTPGLWGKREKRRGTARLPIFAEVTEHHNG